MHELIPDRLLTPTISSEDSQNEKYLQDKLAIIDM